MPTSVISLLRIGIGGQPPNLVANGFMESEDFIRNAKSVQSHDLCGDGVWG